jgi:hypothetical protein
LTTFLPGEFAEALMDFVPTADGPGNGDAVDAFLRHRLDVVLGQERRRERPGRGAGRVQPCELLGFGVPIDDEQIAAQAAHQRFGDTQDRVRSDGRVDGRSAARQDLRSSLRRQDLAGSGNPARADDDGAAVAPAEHLCVQDAHGE